MNALLEAPTRSHIDSRPQPKLDPDRHNPRRKSAEQSSRALERREVIDTFRQENLLFGNIDWTIFGWMVAMHAGCLVAPFFFSWQAVAAAVVLHWLTCSIGICLGYHRFLSHKSLKLAAPARFFTLMCGAISGEGSPLTWAATHRLHHSRSDQEGDPHSPLEGPWWSHILWLFVRRSKTQQAAMYRQFVPDLVKDPMLQFFERTYGYWLIGTGAILFLIGGWSLFLWAMCVRMVVAYHSTWFVNSATHLWGYRNYETKDESRNLWWVAILSYGEGWHNNHHAYPRVARAGHKWWEIDPTWYAIKLLRSIGMATDVHDRLPEQPQPEEATT